MNRARISAWPSMKPATIPVRSAAQNQIGQ